MNNEKFEFSEEVMVRILIELYFEEIRNETERQRKDREWIRKICSECKQGEDE